MSNTKREKFIVRVIRKREIEIPTHKDSTSQAPRMEEETAQVYEQEFDKLDIGDFAIMLNRKEQKTSQEKDDKSLKL